MDEPTDSEDPEYFDEYEKEADTILNERFLEPCGFVYIVLILSVCDYIQTSFAWVVVWEDPLEEKEEDYGSIEEQRKHETAYFFDVSLVSLYKEGKCKRNEITILR